MTVALVTGATGNVGSEVVRRLLADGAGVRALTRAGRSGALPESVEAVTGDLDDPPSLAGALEGADALFLLPGFSDMPGVVAQAGAAGVRRIVLLSGSSAGDVDSDNAISQYMAASEAAVRGGDAAWTFLRPNGFMSNTLQWVPQLAQGDVVRAPFADARIAMIDPYDIGAVAAAALLGDAYAGRVLPLSGPEPLLPADRVRILGEVLDRPLRLDPMSDDEARADFSASMPQKYVDAFFDFYVDGTLDESVVYPTVQEVCSRPPRSFREWARAHATAFSR
jgi:uncharacterized protein YbjT (DUF2867 family)